MTLILSFVLVVLSSLSSYAEHGQKQCCEHNSPFNSTHRCMNGSVLLFHCTGGDAVIADSNGKQREKFTVEGDVLTVQNSNGNFNYTEFCVNKMVIVSSEDNKSSVHDVAVICLSGESQTSHLWSHVKGIMHFVSGIFLSLTLIVYMYLKELREVQDICILNFVINLSVTYIVLGIVQFATEIPTVPCTWLAYTLYLFSLCAFFWMNISSFNMWKLSKGLYTDGYKILAIYTFVCYGIPILCLIIIIILQNEPGEHPKPNFGVSFCWFEDEVAKWYYYYSIMSILLVLNIIYFLDSGRTLWKTYRQQKQLTRIRSLRYKFCLYFKLFLVMGISWCFEILSVTVLNKLEIIVLPTDIINCLQGLIIFIVLIATRKRVLQLLAKKNPFNLFPQSWTRGVDMETDDVIEDDTRMVSTSQ